MSNILKYRKEHEAELLALLGNAPDWNSFLSEGAIGTFKEALLKGEIYLCKYEGRICGYVRALVDGFGIYVSELYVAPQFRGNLFGSMLLRKVKHANRNQNVYMLSDENMYYKKLGISALARFISYELVNKWILHQRFSQIDGIG